MPLFYTIHTYGGVCVANLFSFLCCALYFVCFRPVSCVPNVSTVSGLSISVFSHVYLFVIFQFEPVQEATLLFNC